jgi:hypothetical protein
MSERPDLSKLSNAEVVKRLHEAASADKELCRQLMGVLREVRARGLESADGFKEIVQACAENGITADRGPYTDL